MSNPNILVTEVVEEKVSSLKTFPGNPRKGNIQAIAESLRANKQYRPLVVQKSTRHVLAGNHTFMAAKSLGWEWIAVTYIDVNDEQAKRIVVADNRTTDLAEMDNAALAAILATIPDVAGTGYTEQERTALIENILESNHDNDGLLQRLVDEGGSSDGGVQRTLEDLIAEGDDDELSPEVREALYDNQSLEGAEQEDADGLGGNTVRLAELQAVLETKESLIFKSSNFLGIPDLLESMLLEELPGKVDTWAGKDVTPDDGTTWWLWNYGVASGGGLPKERSILSFYTYDTNFENWWDLPAFNTAKYLVSGGRIAIVPDFSFWFDDPRVVQMYSIYKAQWMGRFFQEAGLKVIPRINAGDKKSWEYAFQGIPTGAPVVSICIQTVDQRTEPEITASAKRWIEHGINNVVKPKTLLFYGGRGWQKTVSELPLNCEVVHVDNYAHKRRGVAFDKKEGKAGEKKPRSEG